ncbi:hypothetical protein DCO44_15970 [Acinetobacter sp. AM]|uniref:DUF6516 family protein n=1 Tax=Acinetobacter sp. AM TaxID=2170730 RepID=UPI000DE639ED|nr:DUF6516 family protein [Acinetobacter sp. AM]PWB13052.1 hypothetical protein DCO44_15970 [Acinetobacter sp. AM]
MHIKEMLEICFKQNLNGAQIDKCITTIAGNSLNIEIPLVPVQINTPQELLVMMKNSDQAHILVDGGVFHFNAIYNNLNSKFPASRVYFAKAKELMTVARLSAYLQKNGINLLPIKDNQFAEIIGVQNYPTRFNEWKVNRENKDRIFTQLLEGRLKNTAVEKGIWLSSNNHCLICNTETNRMSTTTIVSKTGLIIGMQLCTKHELEAQNQKNLINFLAENYGIPPIFVLDAEITNHNRAALVMTANMLKEDFDCKLEKICTEEYTITAKRKSGCTIIIRQTALNNYAYMIKDPNGKDISRIDSADHHEVAYGPDHIHRNLSKSKRKKNNKMIVESSFTYGYAPLDIKIIKEIVLSAEQNYID